MDEIIPIVIIPCHFERRDKLCVTTIKRVDEALKIARGRASKEVFFIITGNVPYEKGAKTLCDLMRSYLVCQGVTDNKIILGEGVGIYSEAKNVTKQIRKAFDSSTRFFVVSSDWYFLPGGIIWRYFAHKNGIEASFQRVRGTGGEKTKKLYRRYAFFVRYAFRFHVGWLLGRLLTFLQQGRKKGFTMDGCG